MDQTGRIEAIIYFPEKGSQGIRAEERNVSPEYGLEGDWHGEKGDASLTLWTKEARNALEQEHFSGICFQRFRENLLVSGLDLSGLRPGARLRTGNVVLEVEKRKRCHPEVCPLAEGREDCLLKKQSLFVKVQSPGTLIRNAVISVEEETE